MLVFKMPLSTGYKGVLGPVTAELLLPGAQLVLLLMGMAGYSPT